MPAAYTIPTARRVQSARATACMGIYTQQRRLRRVSAPHSLMVFLIGGPAMSSLLLSPDICVIREDLPCDALYVAALLFLAGVSGIPRWLYASALHTQPGCIENSSST